MTDAELEHAFRQPHYLELNQKRFNVLETCQIDFSGKMVFEPGAGIGDNTQWLLDHGATVHASDARDCNVDYMKRRFDGNGRVTVQKFDVEDPRDAIPEFDICVCLGLLYHIASPQKFLKWASEGCSIMVLESMVASGEMSTWGVAEDTRDPSQSYSGLGSRPTRDFYLGLLSGLYDKVSWMFYGFTSGDRGFWVGRK